MANYRLFFIGADNHISKADVLDCPTDDDAVAIARLVFGEYQAVEVWQLDRLVTRVDADLVSSDGSS
jgi:hypothetical protein